MTPSGLPARRRPPAKSAQDSPENLLKSLIHALDPAAPDSENQTDGQECEEVIFDAVLEGAHYLLIRLPRVSRPRVQLSPREQEIVRMVAQGHPNKTIAAVLCISSWTVCTHMRRIFAKLGVGSRAAMVARLMENGVPHDQPHSAVEHANGAPAKPVTAAKSASVRPTIPIPHRVGAS